MMSNEIETLDNISDYMNRYISPLIFIFGTIGNILNCFVLSQRRFRSNSCAFLFLASSFVDLISILIGLITRILAGWHMDPTATITWICRFRVFVVFSTRTLAIWLITLATIDRWLLSSTSIHRRQLSSLRNARIGTLIFAVFSLCSYFHMTFCYEAKQNDQPLKCYGGTAECRLATDLIYILITILLPLLLMTIFGLLTISNIRQVQNRVNILHRKSISHTSERIPTLSVIHEEAHGKKTNRHLLRMLVVQIICLIIFCLPQAVQKFHITFQPFGTGTLLEDAIKKFLYNLEVLLAFVASGMPFYIYTLAGGVMFRKGFLDLVRNSVRRMKRIFWNI